MCIFHLVFIIRWALKEEVVTGAVNKWAAITPRSKTCAAILTLFYLSDFTQ